jgi:hypothetical protein
MTGDERDLNLRFRPHRAILRIIRTTDAYKPINLSLVYLAFALY